MNIKGPVDKEQLINCIDLEYALKQLFTVPNGNIEQLDRLEDGSLTVFIWNFDEWIPCSSAQRTDFNTVIVSKSLLEMPLEGITKNVAWSFFSLKPRLDDGDFADADRKVLKTSFVFPKITSEDERIVCLHNALAKHLDSSYVISKLDHKRTSKHFCQFSGGGDLCISRPIEKSDPLVFLGSQNDSDQTGNSSTEQPSVGNQNIRVSPIQLGTSTSPILCIEGKKEFCDDDKLKFQLWANMVVVSVTGFINRLPKFTDNDLLEVTQITGYGIACTGNGTTGVFKLSMEFGKFTKIYTKVELGNRPRLNAAVLVDCALDYYTQVVEQFS